MVYQLRDGEAVYLAYDLALGVDADDALAVLLKNLVLPHIGAEDLLLKGLAHMVDADELLAAGLRAGRRLDQDLGDLIKLRRKLVPVLRETRGPFDDLADGGRGKVEPALARDEARDKLRDLILAPSQTRPLS